MSSCSIKWCGKNSRNSSFKTDKITFHRFPKDPAIKEIWLDATKRENWFPSNYSVICSRHFTEDSFMVSKQNRRRLTESATPTLFLPVLAGDGNPLDPEHKPVKKEKGTLRSKAIAVSNKSTPSSTNQGPTLAKILPWPISTIPIINIGKVFTIQQDPPPEQPNLQVKKRLNKRILTMSKKNAQKNKLIKNLREQVRYLKKKVDSLNETVRDLESKNFITIEIVDPLKNMAPNDEPSDN